MFLDPKNVERQKSSFAALPKGWYRALITESKGRETQNGGGRYLQLTYDIIEGEYKGRKVWGMYNVKNDNEMAVKIGLSDLATLSEVLDHPEPFKFENDFHRFVKDKTLMIKLGQRKDKQSGDLKNRIDDYRADDGSFATEPAEGDVAGLDDIPF